MAYTQDKTGAITISGWEKGISNNPYEGITDMRGVNIVSVPGEASVNFGVTTATDPNVSGSITSADSVAKTITISGANIQAGQAIKISGASVPVGLSATRTVQDGVANSTTTITSATMAFTSADVGKSIYGDDIPAYTTIASVTNATTAVMSLSALATSGGLQFSMDTPYWAVPAGAGVYFLYTESTLSNLAPITGTGTGTYATVNMGQPKYYTHLSAPFVDAYFMVDSNGLVWSNGLSSIGNWRYTGNSITVSFGGGIGNGLVSYIPSDSANTALAYVFVFRNYQIDFATITSNASLVWTYGWNPATGTTSQKNYLKSYGTGGSNILNHEAIVAPDNKVYYCDGNWIGRFYQTAISTGFNPASGNTTTHTADNTKVLPATDTAQCLAPLGNTLLIGGINNIIYPWDTFSQLPSFPIFVAEYNIQKMITVNTNTFIFAGNRGRIYYTNGAQAQLFKKVPDHISGTVEPYFTWGGIASNKNQLYFGVKGLTNAGASLSGYGGLWAIDLDTKAIRLMNLLSYNTELGYATAIIPNFSTNPAGAGIYIGWDSGVSAYGIDTTSSTPQTSYTAYIETDIIPVGTFLDKKTFSNLEFKLSTPMVAGEGIRISQRSNINGAWTQVGETTTTVLSDVYPVNFESTQWVQFKIEMKSTASNPSYVRLRNLLLR
jgi:hypothetical protein